jgi:uncharacterized membrane protein YtjA (UPF0391 family)
MDLREVMRIRTLRDTGRNRRSEIDGGIQMLRWALIFFVISIVAGLFGFTGISAASGGIARVLFFIFLVVFLIFLVLSITGVQTIF